MEKGIVGKGKDASLAAEAGAAMEGGMVLYLEGIRPESLTGIQGTCRALEERQNLLGFGARIALQSHGSGCRAPTKNLASLVGALDEEKDVLNDSSFQRHREGWYWADTKPDIQGPLGPLLLSGCDMLGPVMEVEGNMGAQGHSMGWMWSRWVERAPAAACIV